MDSLEICHLTDIGGKSTNEDKLLAKRFNGLHLLAVADGLGGQTAGEIASSVALVEIEGTLKTKLKEEDIRNTVKEAVSKANKEIYLLSKENPAYSGMGTTLVMALVWQGKASIANVGDSRAYHLSGSQIRQITRDHSVVQELLERGLITTEESRHHPQRSSLTRALGIEPEVRVDIYDIELLPGDIVLLCSDGLSDSLKDEEISEVISSSVNLDGACANLIERAKKKDARDNISVILARENKG